MERVHVLLWLLRALLTSTTKRNTIRFVTLLLRTDCYNSNRLAGLLRWAGGRTTEQAEKQGTSKGNRRRRCRNEPSRNLPFEI